MRKVGTGFPKKLRDNKIARFDSIESITLQAQDETKKND